MTERKYFCFMEFGIKKETNIGTVLFLLIFAICISFITVNYFRNAWDWFVVPLGLPSLSYWHAYGLNLFISQLTPSSKIDKENPYLDIIMRFFVSTIIYFILMGIHSLM